MKWIEKNIAFLICVLLILTAISPILFSLNSFHKIFDLSKSGDIGSAIGGITAPFLGLVTIGLIYLTYQSQKKELEETRIILKEQNNSIEREQFENTFFKLLTNHAALIKSFEVNVPPKTILDSMAARLEHVARYYNFAIATKKIPGFQMFNYNPKHDQIFDDELVEKIIIDINHISEFIITKKRFLSNEDSLFYFMSLFNSLYNCEKYLYGYHVDVDLVKYYNVNSANINSVYNEYYNNAPLEHKIKHSDINSFYPPIDVFLTPYEEIHIDMMKLNYNHPILLIENINEVSITIKDIKINTFRDLDAVYGVRIDGFKETKLEQNQRVRIDFFDYINLNYFKGELTHLLTNPTDDSISKINKYLDAFIKLEDRDKNILVLEISVSDDKENLFKYYGEVFFLLPMSHHHNFEFKLQQVFDENLLSKLVRLE